MGFEFLAQSSLRISVFVKSLWTYITRQREHNHSFFARRREKCANARLAFNRTNGLHLAGTLLSRERQRRNAVDLSNLSLIDAGRDRLRAEQPGAATVIRRGDGTHLHCVAEIPHCQRPAARLALERTTTTEVGDNT